MIEISPRDAYLRLRILSRCLVDGSCDESMVRELSRYDTVGLARRLKFRRSAVRDSHGRGRVSARVRFSGSTAPRVIFIGHKVPERSGSYCLQNSKHFSIGTRRAPIYHAFAPRHRPIRPQSARQTSRVTPLGPTQGQIFTATSSVLPYHTPHTTRIRICSVFRDFEPTARNLSDSEANDGLCSPLLSLLPAPNFQVNQSNSTR